MVVGERDWNTPIVSGAISLVVLNPAWRVPESIATKEMLPAARRNANYFHEKEIQVCNTGTCDLHVTSVSFVPATADFQIVEPSPTPGSPLVISPDSCVPFHIRFTPTSCGPKAAILQILSDDPTTPVFVCPVQGDTQCASAADLDVPAGIPFRATVIQQHGNCFTDALPAYPTHIKGHPPGLVFLLWALSRVGADVRLQGLRPPHRPGLAPPGRALPPARRRCQPSRPLFR